MSVNIIPVPVGWTPEQTWELLRQNELPGSPGNVYLAHPQGEPSWAAIEVDDETQNLVRVIFPWADVIPLR